MILGQMKFEEEWDYLKNGIIKIAKIVDGLPEEPITPDEYMTLYTIVYNMMTNQSERSLDLYNKLTETIQQYLTLTVLPCLRTKHDEYLLRELVLRWSNYKILLRFICHFFSYLDRFFLSKIQYLSLRKFGLMCFCDSVYNVVKSNVKDVILALIKKEREGGKIDRSLIKNVLNIFVEIGSDKMERYEEDFESFMLQNTSFYYSLQASRWMHEQDSTPYFLSKVEECLIKERERAISYLHSTSEEKLMERVENDLLVVFSHQLIENENTGCPALLKFNMGEDLKRMYRLYHKIPLSLGTIADIFKKHVVAEGNALVKLAEDIATNKVVNTDGAQEQMLIRKLLELNDKYTIYVTEYFQNNTLLLKVSKEAFSIFCNKTVAGNSIAELLATFCDYILKKGGTEKLSDEVIEDMIEKAIKLLAYINDKDIFSEFHRKKLARRLLFDRNVNEDHERSLLTKLREECGAQFTSKMEGMITDMILARENQKSFEEYMNTDLAVNPGIDLTVNVLTSGFWPNYKSSAINLPNEMVKCVEAFKSFYESKTYKRKLSWVYSLGNCQIMGNFDAKRIELVVSTYQAALLLLFNDTERLTYNEIMDQLNLTHEDIVRLLHSLSCAKYKILTKIPNTKTVSTTDVFEFNSKFTDRSRKIKIPLPLIDDRKKVIEDVEDDRRHVINAAIVRIMKGRKTLEYQQLVSECIQYLSKMFKPNIKTIKERIEDLINKEFIARDPNNSNVFNYIA